MPLDITEINEVVKRTLFAPVDTEGLKDEEYCAKQKITQETLDQRRKTFERYKDVVLHIKRLRPDEFAPLPYELESAKAAEMVRVESLRKMHMDDPKARVHSSSFVTQEYALWQIEYFRKCLVMMLVEAEGIRNSKSERITDVNKVIEALIGNQLAGVALTRCFEAQTPDVTQIFT